MSESFSSPGIDPPSPTLSARLHELADYLAAPAAGRLTEEQRALSLGIARRLVSDIALQLDPAIDTDALWGDWLQGGLPSASRLAGICFARAEEHRWRDQAAQRSSTQPIPTESQATPTDDWVKDEPLSDVDHAYLMLQIADRRRFDAFGNPCLAIVDVDSKIFQMLLLDIAAWRLAEVSQDRHRAAKLGETVKILGDRQANAPGIGKAAQDYVDLLGPALPEAAGAAIARHDWPTVIALAATMHRRSYSDMALTLLTAETAVLPSLLAPLRLDRGAIAQLEASLAMLPARAVSDVDDRNGSGNVAATRRSR